MFINGYQVYELNDLILYVLIYLEILKSDQFRPIFILENISHPTFVLHRQWIIRTCIVYCLRVVFFPWISSSMCVC